MNFQDKNLLVIATHYIAFVKNQVDALSKYFEKVIVIAPTPYVPKFLSKFSFMNPRWKRDAFASDYKYGNVEVYFAKHFTLPFNFSRKKRGDAAFKAVNKIIQNNGLQFDLIHAHFSYPSGYVGAKLKEIRKRPVLLTVHEDRDWLLKEISSGDEKLIYCWRNVDKLIRVNKRDLEEFEKIGISKSKLLSIPNGFSSNLFRPENVDIARKELGLPIDKKILVNIANLEKYKGQKYLIEAMKKILAKRKDVLLYIVGQGSLKKSLQSLINEHGLGNNIVLAGGNKPSEEILLWMNACDVFVLPSLSESFGIVQIEAMACGKPIVATFNGGSEEIIINEKLGILVGPKAINELANAILRALDKEWDKDYILNYAKHYSWDRIVKNIIGVYNELLEKK